MLLILIPVAWQSVAYDIPQRILDKTCYEWQLNHTAPAHQILINISNWTTSDIGDGYDIKGNAPP
jgi:hypothetical protein